MGHKKRQRLDIEDILARPWCYYCERDFEDLKLLISHQKAKHFKCDRCGRRLNTAGGLSVHMNQVHKETLTQVENALPNRQGLDVEIFGMEGIPVDILDQHRTRIVQNFYQAQEDRRIATGNVQPHGARGAGSNPPRKKIRIETKEEVQARLKEYVARKKAEKEAAAAGGGPVEGQGQAEQQQQQQQQQGQQQEFNPAYPPQAYADAQQQAYAQHYAQPGAYPPSQQAYPPSQQQQQQQAMPSSLPARPPIPPPGLPQRPGGGWPAGGAAPGDDIDQLIRMAEAGIKPPLKDGGAPAPAAAPAAGAESAADKKAKRERARMVYSDPDEVSPEERMARLARYAFVEVGA